MVMQIRNQSLICEVTKQLRFTPSSNNPTFGTASVVKSSVTATSTTVTSLLTVPAVQPWELLRTTARLLSRDSTLLLVDSVVSSINSVTAF